MGQVPGVLTRVENVQRGRGGKLGRGGSHRELRAVATSREAPHKESVWPGALLPLVPLARPLLALGPDPVRHQLDPSLLPTHRHLGVGRHIRMGAPRATAPPRPAPPLRPLSPAPHCMPPASP